MVTYNHSGFSYNETGAIYNQIEIKRTATGSGSSSEGTTEFYNGIRTATGSGGSTAGDSATRKVIKFRSASDTSSVGGSATTFIAATILALDHPTLGTLDNHILSTASYIVHFVDATGSGTGTEGTTEFYNGIRTATGSGGATAGDTATRAVVKIRSASDTNGTGGSATTFLVATILALDHPTLGTLDDHKLSESTFTVFFPNASGSGTGAGTALRNVVLFRTASASGIGGESATRQVIKIRSASDTTSTGGSATTELAAKPLFLDDEDGQGTLDFNILSLLDFARLKRTGTNTGVGAGTTASFTVRFRSASDNTATGGSATVSVAFGVIIRSASDTNGTGGSATIQLLKRIVTATGSGSSSQSSLSFTTRFRTGTDTTATGGFAITPWDIVDVFEPTRLLVEIELTSTPFLDTAVMSLDTGLLDTNTLGARNYYNVTEFVKEVTISRGRSRQLDSFNAGTATVVFNDPTRQFDPTNTLSRFFGGIIPRQPVRISANGYRLFTGFIEDWNLDYTQPTMLTTSISCVDGFSLLSTIILDEYSATNGERTDERIETILSLAEVDVNEYAELLQTSLETGTVTLMDDLIPEGTVLLDYLQEINRAEQGFLFMDASDNLKFIARGAASSLAVSEGSIPVFTDNIEIETDFKYLELSIQFGTELLFNRITTQNKDSAVVNTVNDEGSQIDYLIRDYQLTDLILETDAQALALANYLLGIYARPIFRYDSVSVSATGITNNRKNRLFSIDIADLVRTTRNFAVGTPSEVTRYSTVEGIEHRIDLNSHVIRYSLNTLDYTP